MFLINDIEFLAQLCKHRIIDFQLHPKSVAVSAIRLHDFSWGLRQTFEKHLEIQIIHADDYFHDWCHDKRKYMSVGELSTIHLAILDPTFKLVLSPEDELMAKSIKGSGLAIFDFDDLADSVASSEKSKAIYHILKDGIFPQSTNKDSMYV